MKELNDDQIATLKALNGLKLTSKELALKLKQTNSNTYNRMRKLEARGLVKKTDEYKSKRYEISWMGKRALKELSNA